MKARILNDNEFEGIYTLEFLINNAESTFDWVLTDILPLPNLIKPKWNGSEWIEEMTSQQINQQKIQKAIEIDLEYTQKITLLLAKAIEKKNCDGIEIPAEKLAERDALRIECNNKILELGITDFTYRKSVRGL